MKAAPEAVLAGAAPSFWWQEPGWRAAALSPLAALYGAVATYRLHHAPREKVALPVLCVGNFTVGGSGKTPVVAALAAAARAMGRSPGILSRGYGGSVTGPHLVASGDDAGRVGDEPLLLAASAPVAVSRDRAAGARLLEAKGCDFLIMDDGFQSAQLHMDYALLVLDARHGVGNGHVLPAGPLRAPLARQMRFATAILLMGEGDGAAGVMRRAAQAARPVFRAAIRPRASLTGRRLLAFAGIGHPSKFFATAAEAGGSVVETRAFADHHVYSEAELAALAQDAEKAELDLATTAKDAVRIGRARLEALMPGRVHVLDIGAVFAEEDAPRRIIEATLAAAGTRGS